MPHTKTTVRLPAPPTTDTLQPKEPDVARLVEANFGDEADIAHHSDDLADRPPVSPSAQDSARER
ncbi:hypothetical protein DFP86_10276 [Paludibacterium purpuratum]|uniref:Uncharacterized protein n=1 Tax=Paludibacterium purpuratum TaxID=1144873 RepID=A0A4R7BDX5_9NEIS|nr:hypothetical protein DFP86_10276 [Paludibacterium purpuratum]